MKLCCFSVRDVKADHFGRPFFALTFGEALRSFQMECENPESMLHRFPDDFRLFNVGSFDQADGMLEGWAPLDIACARDFVKPGVAEQLELISRKEA